MRRVIIAGSRVYPNHENVYQIHNWLNKAFELFKPEIILCGRAQGMDQMGERYAQNHDTLVEHFPAQWKTHGKSAGYLRNVEMADKADALWLVWNGTSKGSQHMLTIATERQLTVLEYKL